MGISIKSLTKKAKKLGSKAVRATLAVGTGGVSEIGYKIERDAKDKRVKQRAEARIADSDRASARDYQDQMLGIAREQRAGEQEWLDTEQQRWEDTYQPMEQGIVDDLNAGPALEQQAAIAGSDFASAFDASTGARNRSDMRLGMRPGQSAMRMRGENDAFDRARGIAEAKTGARREEDDRHFLRTQAFYQNNGSGIRGRLLDGMRNMYGSEYNATGNVASQRLQSAGIHDNFANQYGEESKAGWNAAINIGTRLGTAALTGGKSEAVGAAGGAGATSLYQPAGIQPSGAVTSPTNTNRSRGVMMPVRNNYMNDGSTPVKGQTRAAARGAIQSEINRY